MLRPRWRKVLLDLWGNKIRTLLVIMSIAVGVFAVGIVSSCFVILLNDMDADYQSVNPHGAIIYCVPFDDGLLETIRRIPEVGDVEGRSAISGRVEVEPGKKIPIEIIGISAVEEMNIDRIREPDGGEVTRELLDHEIFLERSSMATLAVEPGDKIEIEITNGKTREVTVAGYVHDVANPPFLFTNQYQAFANRDTIEWLGGSRFYSQIYLTTAEGKMDEAHVRRVAEMVVDKIEKSGRIVYFNFVYQPGRHFASDITKSLGVMMGFLGGLAVFLSAFLVINTINALLSQHVRQIGMMKAIGGSASQLLLMYLVLVLCFGILALLIAMPLSAVVGYGTSMLIANFLNFNLGGFRLPLLSFVLQLAIALFIPVVAALVPVYKGTRVTIREAISNYGLGKGRFGKNFIDRFLENIKGLPRPLLISLRNAFRRKGRLFLTLSTLILGGAIFIAVFNVKAGFYQAIDETMGYFLSDVNIDFNRPYRIQQLEAIADTVQGVNRIEGWGFSNAELLIGEGDQQKADEITFIAPPAGSTLIKPSLTAGRWLIPEDETALVVGNHFMKLYPDTQIGDTVTVRIDNKEYDWVIVGEYKMAGNVLTPLVYTNYNYLARLQNMIDQAYSLRVVTNSHSALVQNRVAKELEARFREAGVQVNQITTGAENIQQQRVSIDVLVYTLLVMAVLIALVGGLGLTGMMSMNVLERTREIGVLRAIGASDMAIQQLVIVEGVLIGVISWIFGTLMSLPITMLLAYVVGVSFVNMPLPFIFAMDGFMIWLVGIMVISALASAIPARNASRLTVREVLAYE